MLLPVRPFCQLVACPYQLDAPTRLLGSKLDVDGISYLILNATAGGSQSVTIALSKSSAPPPDRPGSITYLCAPDNVWNMRILSASVKPYTTCTISGATLAGGVVNATIYPVASRGAAHSRCAAIYDRASGNTFTVETIPAVAGVSMLIPSSNFGSNTSLPDGDALIFPRQKVTIPDPFTAGSDLRYGYFAVSTVDGSILQTRSDHNWEPCKHSGERRPTVAPSRLELVYDSTPPPTPTGGPDPDGPNVYATPPDYYNPLLLHITMDKHTWITLSGFPRTRQVHFCCRRGPWKVAEGIRIQITPHLLIVSWLILPESSITSI